MTNIYDAMVHFKNTKNPNWSMTSLVSSKLVSLLRQTTGIELQGDEPHFTKNISVCGLEVAMDYFFKYGSATLSLKDNELEVGFYFVHKDDNVYKTPFNAKQCRVYLDRDLNFKEAVFNYRVTFLKSLLNNYDNSSEYADIKIQKIINKDSITTTFKYQNYSTSKEYISLHDKGLDTDFFIDDINFEVFFSNFMDSCSMSPHHFDELFPEYPSYLEFIENIQKAVEFLNLFKFQYINQFDLLKSRLLLLDMQTI
jgi:hypothetical protein